MDIISMCSDWLQHIFNGLYYIHVFRLVISRLGVTGNIFPLYFIVSLNVSTEDMDMYNLY